MQQTIVDQPTTNNARRPLIARLYVALGVLAVLAVAVLAIWGLIALASSQYTPQIEAIRDILIIALALESCLFGVAILLLLIMVIRLVNMLEFEVKPILEKTNETIGMLRGTTTFVSENVVQPVTRANSYMAATRGALKTLFGDPRQNLPD